MIEIILWIELPWPKFHNIIPQLKKENVETIFLAFL